MKEMFDIFLFTVVETFKKKTFIVVNIVMIICILFLSNLMNIIDYFDKDDSVKKVLIVDSNNIYNGILTDFSMEDLNTDVEVMNVEVDDDFITENKDTYNYIIDINNDENIVSYNYYSQSNSISMDASVIIQSLTEVYKNIKISELNLSADEYLLINPEFNTIVINADDFSVTENDDAENIIYIFSCLLFIGITTFSQQITGLISTEKTSKIVEVLLTSTNSKNIVLGKTYAVGFIGLVQLLFLSIFGYLSFKFFSPPEFVDLITFELNLSFINMLVLLVYFILGYFLYAFMFALTGSLVNKAEDLQVVNIPVTFILVAAFYLTVFTSYDYHSFLNEFSSFFPFSSPFSMPGRFIAGVSSFSDLIISVLILMMTIKVISIIATRIYSNSILNNGLVYKMKILKTLFTVKDNI